MKLVNETYELYKNGDVYSQKHRKSNKGRGHNGKWLQKNLAKNGYYYYTLGRGIGRIAVHRLIAENYIPNPSNLKCVNHKNGIKTDNRIENLEWCTHGQNNQHAYDTGLKPKLYGKNNKFSEAVVQLSKDGVFIAKFDSGMCAQRSDEKFKASHINACCNGKRKSHAGYLWVKEDNYSTCKLKGKQ